MGAVPGYLEDTLPDPKSTDLPQNRFIRAVTRTGVAITGRRVEEDTLTVRLSIPASAEKWVFKMHDVTDSGILTTAPDVLFTGSREGYFRALDARIGTPLWHAITGGQISSAAITYMVESKQYIAISANHAVLAFALRE